jgi:hypothetical protein
VLFAFDTILFLAWRGIIEHNSLFRLIRHDVEPILIYGPEARRP